MHATLATWEVEARRALVELVAGGTAALSGSFPEDVEALASGEIEAAEDELLRRRYVLIGGFPELAAIEPAEDEASAILRSQRVLRADAVQTVVYKDLPQAYGIGEPLKLERLVYTLAGQFCGLLSPSTIAKDVQLSQPTVDQYVRYLEDAFLIFTLANYSSSEESVQRRGRKLFFCDGALRNAALQRGLAPARDPGEMGLLLENAAAAHLHALSQQTGVRVYHWRDGKHEVDLVYDDLERPMAFEITASRAHKTGGLREFQRRFPRFRGRCYIVRPAAVPAAPDPQSLKPGAVPYDAFLIAAGAAARRAMELRLAT